MTARPPADSPLQAAVAPPTLQPDADAQTFLDAALDRILRAWAEGEDLTVDALARERPDLRDDIAALFDLAREAALMRPTTLPRVPGYEVLREIGRGGMGVVYAARQHGLDRLVALKVLPDGVAGTDRARRRFLAEARSLARLRHAHVVTIHDVVDAGELCAYAMEWIDGKSLADLLEELAHWPRRRPAPELAFGDEHSARLPRDPVVWFCRLGIAIARALGEVHRHGLVHRDVKPSNILLRGDGTPLLSDFGVVRDEQLSLTRTGQIIGTPAFAPPEQLTSDIEGVSPAADVFALGATLHWAFAGTAPFAGRTNHELVKNIGARARRPLTALGLPRDLETIVGKCLEPQIEDRYPNADAVADDLEHLLALRPIKARPLGVVPRSVRLMRRNKRTVVAAALGGALVLTACALGAWLLYQHWTLPGRVATEVRRAQWALLEPTHEEGVILADRGEGPGRAMRFATSAETALAAYDRALAMMPERNDVRREREVVAYAHADLRDDASAVGDAAASRAALVASHAPLPPHLAADGRLFGLHAFLIGDARACHAAWADLDLAPGAVDPLVDAAAGQMHLARDEAAKAYPRLLRALDAWPDAGFLAVGVADCAVRLGDLAKAEQYLALAERLGLRDPFDSHVRVRADLRAAEGRNAEARADYEWMLRNHQSSLVRLHFARLLEGEGELERAVDLLLELFEKQPDRTRYGARLWELAESWWASIPMAVQVTEVLATWNTTESWPRLRRLAAAREVLLQESQETSTANTPSASPTLRRPIGSRSTLPTEMTVMTLSECELLRRVPSTVRDLAARAVLTAETPASRRIAEFAPRTWLALRFGTWPCVVAIGWIATFLATDATGQVQWVNRTPTSGSPSGRSSASAVFDEARGQVLLYGGYSDSGGSSLFDEFWSWNGASNTWTLLASPTPPGPRYTNAFAQEGPSGNTFLLFGGWNGSNSLNDTWRWDGVAWTQLQPASSPGPRWWHALAYDSDRHVVVLFGGHSSTLLRDTWEWDGQTWVAGAPASSPPALEGHAMTYDPVRRRVLLFGGYDGTSRINSTWEWDGAVWSQRTPTNSPSGRSFAAMTWDTARACAVLYGGFPGGGVRLNDLWEWDGTNWTQRTPAPGSAPSARGGSILVYDSARRQSVLFSGKSTGTTHPADTWILEPIAHADYTSTGPGCAGAPGTPSLTAAPGSLPWIGRTFTAQVTSIQDNFPFVSLMLVGFTNPGLSLCLLNRCDCILRASPDVTFTLAPSNNQATWSILIPNDISLLGYSGLQTQVIVFNYLSGLDVDATSNGMQMTIGAR